MLSVQSLLQLLRDFLVRILLSFSVGLALLAREVEFRPNVGSDTFMFSDARLRLGDR